MTDIRIRGISEQGVRTLAVEQDGNGVRRVRGRFHILHVAVVAAQNERIHIRVDLAERGLQKPVQIRQNLKGILSGSAMSDVIGLEKFIEQQILCARQFSEADARLLGIELRRIMALLRR